MISGSHQKKYNSFGRVQKQQRAAVALFFLILATCVVVYFDFLVGNRYYLFLDANDDTFQSYLPAYQMVVRLLRTGNLSLMNLTSGLGANIISMQMVICDPFALILYVVGFFAGESIVPAVLIWAQVVRIICAGMCCYLFLSSFSLCDFSKIVASWAYAFSAFMIGGIGQHYMFATAPVFMVLILWLIEKSVDEKRYLLWLSLCVCVIGFWSLYFCYMILLAAAVYAILRFFQFTEAFTFLNVFKWFIPLLVSVLLGLMMASVVLLPTAFQMVEVSSRISTEKQNILKRLFSFLSSGQVKSQFLRFFSDNAEGTMNLWKGASSYFNTPHLYCSALFVACLPQYLENMFLKKRSKRYLSVWILAAIITLSFFVSTAGVLFNAVVEYTARYVFVLLPAFIYVIAKVLTEAVVNKVFYKIGASLTVAGICVAIIFSNWGESALLTAVLAINYFAGIVSLIWLYSLTKKVFRSVKIVQYGLFFFIVLGVCLESMVDLNLNRNVVYAKPYQKGITTAKTDKIVELDKKEQDNFFRIENSVWGWEMRSAFNNGEVYGYRSASFYNSVLNANIQKFRVDFGDGIHGIAGYYGANVLGRAMDDTLADILGIRYVFTNYKSEEQGWQLLEEYTEKDETNITSQYLYQNKDLKTAGILFYNWYPEQKLDAMGITDRQAQLPFSVSLNQRTNNVGESETVKPKIISAIEEIQADTNSLEIGKGVYALYSSNIENEGIQDIEQGIHISFKSDEMSRPERRVWLNFEIRSESVGLLTVAVNNGNGYSSVYWANHVEKLQGQKIATIEMSLPTDTKQVVISLEGSSEATVSNIKVLATDGKNYTNQGVNLQNPAKGGLIVGTVSTQRPAILVIPVFYETGWKAFVDEKPIEILKADDGLCGIEISSGVHTIELSYDTPALYMGVSISVLGFLLWIIVLFFKKFYVECSCRGRTK